MASVRTFYWEPEMRSLEKRFGRARKVQWRAGNVGDIYNADIVRFLYNAEPINVDSDSKKALFVGSTIHAARAGDVVAGVGAKRPDLPPFEGVERISLYGVRGPLTLDAVSRAGFDTTKVRFMFDPGLLIAKMFPELENVQAERGRVIFVPHYREYGQFRSSSKYALLDVDMTPLDFAREIARAEVVYSSSLHGLIFAHALGRPAVLVEPRTAEPEFKYRDYYASVGLEWRGATSLSDSLKRGVPLLPNVSSLITNAMTDMPSQSELIEAGIATE